MAKISVIVPVYKVEQYIHRCVDSILAQTFTDFDVIMVDDGSPDQCGTICDEYARTDSRINVIHQKNGGLSAARNAGIDWAYAHSDSAWLTFIDSDDWAHPKCLEILYGAVIRDKTKIAIGKALWTKGEGLPDEAEDRSTIWETEKYFGAETVNAIVAWGKIYNKTCFKDIRYPIGKIHEDEYVTYRVLFKEKYISVTDSFTYAYFQNDSGIMKGTWTPKRLDVLEGIEGQVRYFSSKKMVDIAKSRFLVLVGILKQSKRNLAKCESISEQERKKYLRYVNRMMKWALIYQRKYGWLPFNKDASTKQLYVETFFCLRVARKVLRGVKGLLRRFYK